MTAETKDLQKLELNALLEVTQAINNNLPEGDLYRIFKFILLANLQVSKMALFVQDDGWKCKASFGVEESTDDLVLPEQYRELDDELKMDDNLGMFGAFSLSFPVKHKEKLLAVVFLGSWMDLTFVKALSNIIMVAIENKRLARERLKQEAYQRELEIAKKVQQFLFPKSLPETGPIRVEAVYLPHSDVGGDYYDYIKIDAHRFLLCVADVSGKGVGAALLMSNFQASLRALVRRIEDPKSLIEELNHALFLSGNAEHFITFFLGIYNLEDRSFQYVNCGHNPLYIRKNNELLELNEGTTILGMFDPLPFIESKKLEGLSKFTFFGYTDGLTETFNESDEAFGEARLKNLLLSWDDHGLKILHASILEEMNRFRGEAPIHDDITILSCSVNLLG